MQGRTVFFSLPISGKGCPEHSAPLPARAPNRGPSTLPRGDGGIRGWKVLSDAFLKSPLVSEQHQAGFNKGLTEEKQLMKPSSADPSSASCPGWVRAPSGDQLLGGW